MKKLVILLLTLALAVSMALSLSACHLFGFGGDEPDNGGEVPDNKDDGKEEEKDPPKPDDGKDDKDDEEEEVYESDGLEFYLSEGGKSYTVSGIGLCEDSNIVIPRKHEELPVDAIAAGAFAETSISSVEIHDGIKFIGEGAFRSAYHLALLTVDEENPNYKSIDGNLYTKDGKTLIQYCIGINLTEFITPEGVTSVCAGAFRDSILTCITFGVDIAEIDVTAFDGCSMLTAFAVDEGNEVYSVIDGVLYSSDTATLILYPEGKRTTEFIIPDCVNAIGDYAFRNARFAAVVVSANVTHIGASAFYNCALLTNITLSDSVATVGDYAFEGCISLTDIELAAGVSVLGTDVFRGCAYLKKITVNENNITYSANDGNLYSKDGTMLVKYATGKTASSFEVPEGVSEICDYAFCGVERLKTVTFAESVITVGNYAFAGCEALKSVTNTANIDKIGDYAFFGCYSLSWDFTVSGIITSIGDYAFNGCEKIDKIVLPDCIVSVGFSAFGECSFVKSVTLPFVGKSADSESNAYFGYIFGADSYVENGDFIPAVLTDVTITAAQAIPAYAFYGCGSIVNLDLPATLTAVGKDAFFGCDNIDTVRITDLAAWCAVEFTNALANPLSNEAVLYVGENKVENLIIPDGVTEIAPYAFVKCESITAVTLSDAVETIGAHAFDNCKELTCVKIPSALSAIGENAFIGCDKLSQDGVHIVSITDWCEINFENPDANPLCFAGKLFVDIIEEIESEPVVVPYLVDKLEVMGVSEITPYAFYGCTSLTSVAVDGSVLTIGKSAFEACLNIQELTVPYIGRSAEEESDNYLGYIFGANEASENGIAVPEALTELTVTDGVSVIAGNALFGCEYIKKITLPDSVTEIGEAAFGDCTALESITLPFVGGDSMHEGNTCFGYIFGASDYEENAEFVPVSVVDVVITKESKISENAFANCASIKRVSLPASLEHIGEDAFSLCESLEGVYITDIGAWCVIDFKSPTANPLHIANNLYVDDILVETLSVPDSVAEIKPYAFYNCKSIKHAEVPASVLAMGASVFENCSNIESLTVPFAGDSKSGTVATNIGYIFGAPSYLNNKIYIPSSLKSVSITEAPVIYSNAFFDCAYIENIFLGDALGAIGASAFEHCASLTEITIPASVTAISDKAFKNCTSLLSAVMPETVTSIGKSAFAGCVSLAEIAMPKELTVVGSEAFSGCINLEKVEVTDIEKWCAVSFGNCSANPLSYAGELHLNADSVTELEIPGTVSAVGKYAFYGCESIQTLVIKSGVTDISGAFENCVNLVSVTLEDGITSIGDWAFAGCVGLTEVKIPTSVKSIGMFAFQNCYALNNIVIPEGVESIGDWTFYRCENLVSVALPASVKYIGEFAFEFCTNLSAVYYGGSASDWETVVTDSSNANLINATRYYYSEEEPAEEGSFWHYDENGLVAVWPAAQVIS